MKNLKLEYVKETLIERAFTALGWLAVISALVFVLALTGCVNIPKTVAALSKDPSSAHISVKSIYMSIDYTRTNPSTNTPPHTMGPTGNIEVKR